MPTFADLGLPQAVVDVLAANGIETPFPIQAATLPDSLAGRDVLGRGRTGSGKTYAFLLPMVTRLTTSQTKRAAGRPRALILAPTRELVAQIDAALAPLAAATNLRSVTVFGGVSPQPQIQKLRQGVDIVIACPGRLEDHVKSRHADLSAVEITVLDEADHMADLGFLPPVKRLLDKTPRNGQRMLFSATLDGGVDVIVKRYLHNPVEHSVDSAQSPVAAMDHHVLHVDKAARVSVSGRPCRVARAEDRLRAHQARRQESCPSTEFARRACGRVARQPVPERPYPQPRGLLRWFGLRCWSPRTSPRAASTSTT